MTILHTNELREQTLKLLFIECDQVAELLDMVGYGQPPTAPVVVSGKPFIRLSAFGLTHKTLQAAP